MKNVKEFFWNSEEERLRSFWRVVIQFFLFVAAFLAPIGILGKFRNPYTRNLADELITLTLVLFSIYLVVKFVDKRKFSDLGFRFDRNWFVEYFQGLVIGGAVFFTLFLIEYGLGWLNVRNGGHGWDSEYLLKIGGRFLGYTAVAFTEETFSRGYEIKNIAEGLRGVCKTLKRAVFYGLLVSSLIFGGMHYFNPNASLLSTFNLFVIGLFYGYAYVVSGSLALPIGIHAAWNFVQGNVLGFTVSGFEPEVSFFYSTSAGPALATGGKFGPESGLLIFPAMLVSLFLLNFLKNGGLFKFNLREELTEYKRPNKRKDMQMEKKIDF
jgi:membrane protease YdiL (CAAX protease family)